MGVPADTYFRVPDMRGRVPIGYWDALDSDAEPDGDYDNYPDAGGSDPDSTYYGEKEHALTEAEGPTHDHGAATGTDGDHAHDHDSDGAVGSIVTSAAAGSGTPADPDSSGLVQSAGDHTHTIAASGSGDEHENRQLSTVMGYLVYTGVF
jgi:microcystin-dependent protein